MLHWFSSKINLDCHFHNFHMCMFWQICIFCISNIT
nr:MAG TPA: hypothetical protein [Caudoviricetes sp.]DAL78821.1 MAG TPA: hypothetical protein [Caudoviricetes sp.]DAX04509.1 MAG TPA: hypothetical protein [Bacteriophage sp.]